MTDRSELNELNRQVDLNHELRAKLADLEARAMAADEGHKRGMFDIAKYVERLTATIAAHEATIRRLTDDLEDSQSMIDHVSLRGEPFADRTKVLIEHVKHCDEEAGDDGLCCCARAICDALGQVKHESEATLAAHEATIKELQTIRDWVATDHRFPYLQLPPRVIKALDAAKGEPLRNPVHESLAGGDA